MRDSLVRCDRDPRRYICSVVDEFFEAPPPEPISEVEDAESPQWFGPPQGVIPCAVPLGRVLARNDRAAIGIAGALVYDTGFELQFIALLTRETLRETDLFELRHRGGNRDPLAPEVLRIGIEYADGRKAMNTIPRWYRLDEDEVDESAPTMVELGGGGGDREWRESYWCWPLPPPGPLQLVCEWPVLDFPLTRHEIDSQLILDAVAQTQVIFPPSQ